MNMSVHMSENMAQSTHDSLCEPKPQIRNSNNRDIDEIPTISLD